MTDLRVWVGDLSVYAERLRGEWIDVDPDDLDTLRAAFDRITAGGEREHYIGDVEGPAWFRAIIGDWGTLDVIEQCAGIAAAIDADGMDDDYFSAWWDIAGTSYPPRHFSGEELVQHARDDYYAEGDSERDAAMAYAETFTSAEEWEYDYLDPRSCIDWDQYARHLQNDYTFSRSGGTVYVIGSH